MTIFFLTGVMNVDSSYDVYHIFYSFNRNGNTEIHQGRITANSEDELIMKIHQIRNNLNVLYTTGSLDKAAMKISDFELLEVFKLVDNNSELTKMFSNDN